MIQTRQIGSLTELTVENSGGVKYFITESYPTNFHTFQTRKVLARGEKAENYMEVTESERSRMETADAKWQRPDEEMIKKITIVRNCLFGYVFPAKFGQMPRYNEQTGFFEVNGILDIDADEMRHMFLNYDMNPTNISFRFNMSYRCRTNLPLLGTFETDGDRICTSNYNIEVFNGGGVTLRNLNYMFQDCTKLRTIFVDVWNARSDLAANGFYKCPVLEDIYLSHLARNADFRNVPLLSLDSLTWTVEKRVNLNPITITLHPDAYARLTDELIAKAADKQITFASA